MTSLSQNPVQFNNSDKLSQITVEGKTFDLVEVSKDGISQSGWLRVIGGNIQTGQDNLPDQIRKVSVYSSDNLVVGLLSSNISEWHEYAFINGKYTDVRDMPKGSATYSIQYRCLAILNTLFQTIQLEENLTSILIIKL